MRKIISFFLATFISGNSFATYAIVAHTAKQATSQSSGIVTSAIDTTGANLLVVATAFYGDHTLYLSDSKLNSWTYLTVQNNANGGRMQLAYVFNPTVGSGHTFTIASAADYPCVAVMAWSGSVTSPSDQQNGASSTGSAALATGSVTPSEDNEILIAATNVADGGLKTIDLGFTIQDQIDYNNGNAFGIEIAYLIQTSLAAKNPTWTGSLTEPYFATRIATFKAAAGGGGGTVVPDLFGIINNPVGGL